MNLEKTEFQKLRQKKANIIQEKHKMVNVLKGILDQQFENKTCRLCLKPGGKEIFNGGQEFDFALNIRCILGIEITEYDGKPQHICEPCEVTMRRTSKLKQVAEATQWILQQEQEMVSVPKPPASNAQEASQRHAFNGLADDSPETRLVPALFPAADSPDWSDAVSGELCTVEKLPLWQCHECRRRFHSLEEFREHEQERTCRGNRTHYMCESCGIVLKTLYRFKRHRLIHTGELPHACSACPYRARTKYALTTHSRQHSGLRPARCACGAAFGTASALAAHRRAHRPPAHRCARCQRAFTFKAALENHMAAQHSTAKPHGCSICGKAFSTRKMFLHHELRVHKRPKMRGGVPPAYLRQDSVNTEKTGT